MRLPLILLSASATLGLSYAAQAAAPADQVAKLGQSLTQLGAEKAASADGSIPAYTGGNTTLPAGFTAGDSMRPNPYADEKPSLVINSKNAAQYSEHLTATVAELLKRFPDFRIDIYPSHRSAALPQWVLDNSVKNAANATSTGGGVGIANALPGTPFPIPATGSEAMWNHLMRYQGSTANSKYDNWNVDSSGTATLATTGDATISYPFYQDPARTTVSDPKEIFYRVKVVYSAPARRAGEALLLQDAIDPLTQPRRAWQYLPGQRRVKLAPDIAYDTPNPGSAGASTYDDSFVFSGALDRYDWKLIGKKEMFVPYNSYAIVYDKDVAKMTTPNYVNPDKVRWESHRVWVVEGTLKEGMRHIYKTRRFYLDEDTWSALASDQYDARDTLFRGSLAFTAPSYDSKVPVGPAHMIYDLVVGSYNITGMTGPYGGVKYIPDLSNVQWSPESLAGAGIR
jgi:hypothetical protein